MPSFHCKWEQPKLKGKPKHPVKVHVWVDISKMGQTELMMFEGIMDTQFLVSVILINGLLPFIRRTFPNGHRFQQNNDPWHTSCLACNFIGSTGENPPKSPNLNPIKMVCLILTKCLLTQQFVHYVSPQSVVIHHRLVPPAGISY